MNKMKLKPMKLRPSEWNRGIDLEIERDSGNLFLVLMGGKEYSLKNWKKLRTLCNQAIKGLEE